MDAEASPPRSIATHLRGALSACRGAWSHAARLALDIALPTLCVARTLVHALKYQDRTDLAPAMGRWMARAGRELLAEADALVPVPLHWRRGWSRRHNQSGALARSIERQSGGEV